MSNLLPLLLLPLLLLSTVTLADKKPRKIFDITHSIRTGLPIWNSKKGLGADYIRPILSIKNGSTTNEAVYTLETHVGTHVDAPSHFIQKYYDQGFDATTLSLQVLNGPVLVVEVPKDKNISAEVMKSLNIPKGVRRVLFKTLNTDRKLMHQKEFHTDFTAFSADGAKWLVANTDIKLVGLDYLSIATYVDAVPVHHAFLQNRRTVVVEGLNLDEIEPGRYNLHCLPMKLVGADGSPTRCILIR